MEFWDAKIIRSGMCTNNGKASVYSSITCWRLLLKVLQRHRKDLNTAEEQMLSTLVETIRQSLSGSC